MKRIVCILGLVLCAMVSVSAQIDDRLYVQTGKDFYLSENMEIKLLSYRINIDKIETFRVQTPQFQFEAMRPMRYLQELGH